MQNNDRKEEYPELSSKQLERNNELYNAVHDLCKVFAEDWNLEWDMAIIGPIADMIASTLVNNCIPVRFPSVVEGDDGRKHIEEYVDGLVRSD